MPKRHTGHRYWQNTTVVCEDSILHSTTENNYENVPRKMSKLTTENVLLLLLKKLVRYHGLVFF